MKNVFTVTLIRNALDHAQEQSIHPQGVYADFESALYAVEQEIINDGFIPTEIDERDDRALVQAINPRCEYDANEYIIERKAVEKTTAPKFSLLAEMRCKALDEAKADKVKQDQEDALWLAHTLTVATMENNKIEHARQVFESHGLQVLDTHYFTKNEIQMGA